MIHEVMHVLAGLTRMGKNCIPNVPLIFKFLRHQRDIIGIITIIIIIMYKITF